MVGLDIYKLINSRKKTFNNNIISDDLDRYFHGISGIEFKKYGIYVYSGEITFVTGLLYDMLINEPCYKRIVANGCVFKCMTHEQENDLISYCLGIIHLENDKKEEEERSFDLFCRKCYSIAKEYLNREDGRKYDSTLTIGNSYSDKRTSPVIVISKDGHQVGYIKIIPHNNFKDIEIDSCYVGGCHTHWYIEDKDNPIKDIEYACKMAI